MLELDIPPGAEPIGYRFLVEHFHLNTLPHYRWSYVGPGWDSRAFKYENGPELHLYPKSYQIENQPLNHLEFALKHEGVNLLVIKQVLSIIDRQIVINYISSYPTGKYAKKIWFLYEFLLDKQLPLDNLKRGSYVTLLDPAHYYCGTPRKSQRHRVIDNLLGNNAFSPLVRKSFRLKQFEEKQLNLLTDAVVKKYDVETLTRAIRYLFTKETIASWEIEREKPDKARTSKFVTLLQKNYSNREFSKKLLIMLQKEIVDPRFALEDYRTFQNYIGEEPQPGDVLVHYITPRPEDIADLMEGLLKSALRMFSSSMDAIVVASVLSFGFVFMHPFWDGNGRIHRFLIHYTLSKLKFSSDGIVFPVSAVMLREHREYDRILESFSYPLNLLIRDYQMNERSEMTVLQETSDYYKYIDFTLIAEYLYRCVEKTIHTDLDKELDFLSRYDKIKSTVKQLVDLPDRELDLLIRCIQQNQGLLSKRKRDAWFSMLSDKEIKLIEDAINNTST